MPELDELRKAAADAAAARAEARAAKETEIETARLTEELKLDEICAKAGVMLGIDAKAIFAANTGRMVVVKCPGQLGYQAYTQKVIADKCTPQDRFDFVKPCLVYPTLAVYNDIVSETPGMMLKAAEVASNLAAAEEQGTEGK